MITSFEIDEKYLLNYIVVFRNEYKMSMNKTEQLFELFYLEIERNKWLYTQILESKTNVKNEFNKFINRNLTQDDTPEPIDLYTDPHEYDVSNV